MSHDKDNSIDPEISDIYQSTRVDGPPPALDTAILAEAEAAVRPKRRRPAWIAPVGIAATVLLGVNLAVHLRDYSNAPDVYSETAYPPIPTSQDRATVDSALSNQMVNAVTDPDAADSLSIEPDSSVPVAKDEWGANYEDDPQPRITPQLGRTEKSIVEAPAQQNRARPERGFAKLLPGASEPEPSTPPAEQTVATASSAPVSEPRETAQDARAAEAPRIITLDAEQVASAVAAGESTGFESRLMPESAFTNDDQSTGVSEIEEIAVTGSAVERVDDSPHRRLTAKDQAVRSAVKSAQERRRYGTEETMAMSAEADAPVYICDLKALQIDGEAIETAKVDARTAEPPLTSVSWPVAIKELADSGDYVSACVQLAAYRQLFPDVILLEPLPVSLPPEDPINRPPR